MTFDLRPLLRLVTLCLLGVAPLSLPAETAPKEPPSEPPSEPPAKTAAETPREREIRERLERIFEEAEPAPAPERARVLQFLRQYLGEWRGVYELSHLNGEEPFGRVTAVHLFQEFVNREGEIAIAARTSAGDIEGQVIAEGALYLHEGRPIMQMTGQTDDEVEIFVGQIDFAMNQIVWTPIDSEAALNERIEEQFVTTDDGTVIRVRSFELVRRFGGEALILMEGEAWREAAQ